MQPKVPTFLWDVIEASDDILRLTETIEVVDLISDRDLRHLIERKIEIIGEVLSRLRRDYPDVFELVTDGRDYINMRNIVAHNYANVNATILFRTCRDEIPLLRSEVLTILGESEVSTRDK